MLAEIRDKASLLPGTSVTIGQPISHRIDHMLSGTRANVAVKIFGDHLSTLRELAKQVESAMHDIPGVVDLSTEQQVNIPILRVDLDRDAMARLGLRAADVNKALEAAFRGTTVTSILEGRNAFDVVVRVADTSDKAGEVPTPQTVGDVPVGTPSGAVVPLRAVARISEDLGPNFISRENVQRKIVVMCNVANRDLNSVVQDIQEAVSAKIALPSGYFIDYGGQFESAEQTGKVLTVLGVIVVLGIGFLLHVVFRSMRDALLIMVNLPLALIGGVVGVVLTGGELSVASIIGFITVFGIAARNGIMMVSHIRHLQREEGVVDFQEAVRRGAMERLSPIAMTALAAGLAMVPLVLSREQPGTEILSPMAMVILSGLLSSTFLNMLVVPALFIRWGHPTGASAASVYTTGNPD